MNNNLREKLIEVSRNRRIIHYQELCDACNLGLDMRNSPADRMEIGRILGEISAYEHFNERPLLSSVVLTKSGEGGDGFYKLCEKLDFSSDWKKLKNDDQFLMDQINQCHAYWKKYI